MAKATIERRDGQPTLIVNGEVCPPMSVTAGTQDPAYLARLGKAGLRIFYLNSTTDWNTPGGVRQTVEAMEALLDAVPDAWIMLRISVSPPADWLNARPEEQLVYSDGSRRALICTSVSRTQPVDGMYSMASQEWLERGSQELETFVAQLRGCPCFAHVIGFFLCAGGTSEWYYPESITLTDEGIYGDCSAPFRRFFGSWLREKYGTEETLRRVWKRGDADFDQPAIPTLAERVHIRQADRKICDALEKWETVGYTLGRTVDMDAAAPANLGVFLNANDCLHTADFYDAWHDATAQAIVRFARCLRRIVPDLLVGAFYGSYGCTDYYDGGTTTGTLTILDSGAVDFLAAPGVYNNREPGGVVAQREMQDSMRLRGMIYICEDDARTHRAKPDLQRETMGLYTVQDSIETLKRDFARDICEDVRGWWFDMGSWFGKTQPWYDDAQILALFERQQQIARQACAQDRTKHNQIALIYDTQSVHCVSEQTDRLVLDLWRTSDLHRIGAPVDYYFHDDLARDDMPAYKLYIMLNQYCLSVSERDAVYAKARRDGATVLWMYAPGFIDRESAPVMSLANIERTVGMKLHLDAHTAFPYFRITDPAHPALRFADPDRRYGWIDRDVHSNIWVSPTVVPPAYVNPRISIDDASVTALGRYCLDGRVALGMTQTFGVQTVLCCTPTVRSDILASLAAYAGCHLYTGCEDVLYANEHYVALHASFTGRRTLHFKRPCSPFEVYEQRSCGENVTKLDVEMRLGQTKMWQI